MRWDLLPDLTAFDRARRKEAYRRLSETVRGRERAELLDLEDVRSRLGTFRESYVGIEPVPVDRIIGTAGRSRDFDRDFLPLDERLRDRWRKVEQTFPRGDFPPIVVYEVQGSYFVVDGHHRVAVAKQRGVEFIDAEVTRLETKQPLPDDADVGRLIHAEQERRFLEETGLGRSRPGARLRCSRPYGYSELLDVVLVHAYRLSVERGAVVDLPEAAVDWHDRIYAPTLDEVRREGLPDLIPDATEGDLFLWISDRLRALRLEQPEAGVGEAVERARDED